MVAVFRLLNTPDQEVLMLAAWEELTAPEIAVALSISTSAAEQRHSNSRRRCCNDHLKSQPLCAGVRLRCGSKVGEVFLESPAGHSAE